MNNGDTEKSAAPLPTPDEVLEMLRRQAKLFGRLESVAARQRRLIAAEDPGPLMAVLAERRQITGALSLIANDLRPVREAWDAYQAGLDGPQQEQTRRLWQEARRRLRDLISADEEDARLLAAKKQAAARGLGGAFAAQQAVSAYTAPGTGTGRLDRLHPD